MESSKYTSETIKRARELREKQGLTFTEIASRINVPATTLKTWATNQNWNQPPLVEAELLHDPEDPRIQKIEELERKLQAAKAETTKSKAIYKALQTKYEDLQEQVGLIDKVGLPVIEPIKKKEPSGATEATVMMVASDWHVEEEVKPESVNMLNEYNLDISEKRAEKFFQGGLRLTEIVARDVKVTTILLPLLGDFVTNDIHEENREVNILLPMEAIQRAQMYLASGINFLLENTDYKIVIPCHSGNHGRTTKKIFVSTEYGHSLEYFMYKNLEMLFAGNDRVEFHITTAYHSYVDVYDLTIRFHHGHGVRYYGGVGGLYIPVNKSIAQWNRAKKADIDIFGHFHQLKDGGSFVSNGSLIGMNPYAIWIKADYEPPKQIFTVIDSKRGRTITAPIFV